MLGLRAVGFSRMATKDGGTFEDVEIFMESLKL